MSLPGDFIVEITANHSVNDAVERITHTPVAADNATTASAKRTFARHTYSWSSNVTTYPRADIAARSVRFAFGKFLQHRYVKHSKYGSKFFVAKANANILCSQPFHSMWFALGSANSFVERNQNVGRTVAENSVARVVISVEDSVGVRHESPKILFRQTGP